jgi:WD40 repeat protein
LKTKSRNQILAAKENYRSTMKRLISFIALLLSLAAGCQNADTPTAPHVPTPTPNPTATPQPTDTPQPTHTPTPILLPREIEDMEIAFISAPGGNQEIYLMEADGSNQRNITNHPAADSDPQWSPDGKQIAFASNRGQNYDIYVMNADGSDTRRLTTHPEIDAFPVWSPDGTKVAFVSMRDGNAEIYLVYLDGTGLQRLTQNTYSDWEIAWSPDGAYIAVSSQVGAYADIYLIDVEAALQGTEERQQLTDTDAHDAFPRWSPDGNQITFISNREEDDNWEIYAMNRDGSDLRRLTNADGLDGPMSWSPDNTQIVFDSNRDGDNEIYVMNADGSNVRQLTDNDIEDREPAWRPMLSPPSGVKPSMSVEVPKGNTPVIDGTMGPDEWAGALVETLSGHDGYELHLMHAEDYLYLGFRGPSEGIGSLCLYKDDVVTVLHSSAGLGYYRYVKEGTIWQQTRDLMSTACCGDTYHSPELDAHLSREGWLASTYYRGNPREMEYQIALDDGELVLAVAYLLSPDFESFAWWPQHLDDDCGWVGTPSNTEKTAQFSFENWVKILAVED